MKGSEYDKFLKRHNSSLDWLILVKYYIIPDKSIIALVMDSINPFLNNFWDNLVVSNDEKLNIHGFFEFFPKHKSTVSKEFPDLVKS